MANNRTKLVQLEMDEYKAYKDFKDMASPHQIVIHELLKSKMKLWHTANKNYHTATKRSQFNILPKLIAKTDLNFKFNTSHLSKEQIQDKYDKMRQITLNYQRASMELYVTTLAEDSELLKNEIDQIV